MTKHIHAKIMNTHKPLTRRRWIATAGTLAAGAAALPWKKAHAIDYTKPVKEAEGLTAYANHGNLFIRWNNQPLVNYRAQKDLKYPYFHPVNGPLSGLPLTAETALPYPHHRGIWLGVHPLNGGDYWSDQPLETGQIQSAGLKLSEEKSTPTSATFTDQCNWIWPKHPSPFRDQRTFTVKMVPEQKLWTLEMDIKLKALEDIVIKKAKHSFLAIRAASDISCPYGGTLMNSEGGTGAKGTYGQEAKWCGYHGKRKLNPDIVEGITMMTHPRNPWRPVWFTREYGHLSPSPFNFLEEPWQLKKGAGLHLRYQFVLHAQSPKEAGVDAIYENWVK